VAELQIRPLASGDRPQWTPLWHGYLTFYETQLADEVTETTWRRLIDPEAQPFGLAAEEDGRLFGIVHYLFHASTWTSGPYCYLQDLFVAKQARGRGTGAGLIAAVRQKAGEHGASQVYWLTQDFNHQARRLYDRVGQKTPFIKYLGAPLEN
jgi:GNAT superfamily N-acetyltransferase